MEPKQILSANLLDIIFDDRNKAYGAYELRVTYPQRIKKAMLFTFAVAALAFAGAALANSIKPKEPGRLEYKEVTLSNIEQEEKLPEPLPEPERQPDPPQVRTQQFTEFRVVPEEEVVSPPPSQEDLVNTKIDDFTQDGAEDKGLAETEKIDEGKKIIDAPKEADYDGIVDIVQIPAQYDGNWEKFLIKNLNPNVPVDNSAPTGKYTVLIQFVVDKEGNISDLKALTDNGYGMEQEAMRVLRKAKGWKPGIQNGRQVKSYHKQPITFMVTEE